MIKRLLLVFGLLAATENAAEIRPSGGAINRSRISYDTAGVAPSGNTGDDYLRPGGVDTYHRPGDTDLYLRP